MSNQLNLVLVGYRGTGKSAIAGILAEKLQREKVCMDEILVQRFGCSIPDFVAAHGWTVFRDYESELIRELSKRCALVIDCGGGVVTRDENIQLLRQSGKVVWLSASPKVIAQRIQGDNQRPSLTGTKSFIEEIEEVLSQRLPLYQNASDIQINTDTLSILEITEQILDWWNNLEPKYVMNRYS